MTASELAQQIGGELIGAGDVQVHGVSPIDDVKAGHVTLAENEQYFAKADASDAAAIVVSIDVRESRKPVIRVTKTTLALAKMLAIFHPVQKPSPGVHPGAFVGRDVRLGGGVSTIRQYLRAALIDELHLAMRPVLLGSGEHLLNDIDTRALGYECMKYVAGERATHVFLRRRA